MMKNLFKLNWINGLGLSFIFTGFLYFLKMAADAGWLPPVVRAAVGVLSGVCAVFIGFQLFNKGKSYVAELVAGMGSAVIYATVAYVSFSDQINWSPNALLISMVSIGIITSVLAMKREMRLLYNISTLGALVTPLIITASDTQDFMLFIYLLIINVMALYVSGVKKWHELKIVAFVMSLAIYSTYYLMFDPEHWVKPFLYIGSLFLVYIIGLTIGSWNQKDSEFGVDQFLGIINAISFVFWAALIFGNFNVPHTIPMLIVAFIFIGMGALFYYGKGRVFNVINGSYLILGTVVMSIACSDTGMYLAGGMNYVVNSAIWIFLIGAAFAVGKKAEHYIITVGAYVGLVCLTVYWYMYAWDVEWVTVFGMKYVPFFNAGALVWMALAGMGFYFSKHEEKLMVENSSVLNSRVDGQIDYSFLKDKPLLSGVLGVLSHLIVGGLLTVQIGNLWEAYEISMVSENLAMSVTWIVYALMIYLMSSKSKHNIYKVLGSTVLVLTSIKVFAWDLLGSANYQKVIFLMIIGGLTLLIGKVSGARRNKEEMT
jgi:uncharacterized membrane protein